MKVFHCFYLFGFGNTSTIYPIFLRHYLIALLWHRVVPYKAIINEHTSPTASQWPGTIERKAWGYFTELSRVFSPLISQKQPSKLTHHQQRKPLQRERKKIKVTIAPLDDQSNNSHTQDLPNSTKQMRGYLELLWRTLLNSVGQLSIRQVQMPILSVKNPLLCPRPRRRRSGDVCMDSQLRQTHSSVTMLTVQRLSLHFICTT